MRTIAVFLYVIVLKVLDNVKSPEQQSKLGQDLRPDLSVQLRLMVLAEFNLTPVVNDQDHSYSICNITMVELSMIGKLIHAGQICTC